jgi:DNA-binding SARP family transcriptional activator/tetratricopeptide (TPR) repeat protein
MDQLRGVQLQLHRHGCCEAIMEFRLLGPVELWCAGHEYDLGSLKARCVLAVLLLNLGTVVPADALISRVWDGDPPPKAREGLSAYVTRLRRALRQVPGGKVSLASRAGGYSLAAEPTTVDVCRFRQLRRQAARAAEARDYQLVMSLLREADGLWRGEALAGLPGEAMAGIRRGLAEERRAAMLQRAETELALGQHADLVAEFRRLSDQYPSDEEFASVHMRALFLSGRQGDALGAYREIRKRLIEEQGTEPGPALTELHQRMLRRDPDLAPMPSAQPVGKPTPPDTLPPSPKEFVGRAAEIELLTGRPLGVALITGMPGIGKTTLAVMAAHMMRPLFPDGQLFVNFHTHDRHNPPLDAAGALFRLLRMLGIPAETVPPTLTERTRLWHAELARRRMLIILDDVADHQQVLPILPATAESGIMLTSRNRLGVPRESISLPLSELHPEDGIELFNRIAGHAAAGERGAVAEVVRRCGRLPLAIQLVARRLRNQRSATVTGLLEELAHPTAGGYGSPGENQVQAAFDLSYQALPGETRQFFRRLGLHPGTDITVHAAAALAADAPASGAPASGAPALGQPAPGQPAASAPARAEAELAILVNRHLLERTGSGFRFHDVVRTFAAACAAREETRQDRQLAADRLICYYRFTAGRAGQILYPDSGHAPSPAAHSATAMPVMETAEDAVGWLEREWRNALSTARHAYRHERKQHCIALISALARWLERTGHWGEAADAHTLALRACRELEDVPGIARTSMELSLIANRTGHNPQALQHAEVAAAAYRTLGDLSGQAGALDQIGTVHQSSARFRQALAYHQEASQLYRAAADRRGLATTLNRSGIICMHLGRHSAAIEHFESALKLYRQAGDRGGEARTLNNLGRVHLAQGYHREALDNYMLALAGFKEIHADHYVAIAYQNIGGVYLYKADYDVALSMLGEALATYRRTGDLPGELAVLNGIGEAFIGTEDPAAALDHHRRAETIAQQLGDSYEQVIALRGIANSQRALGDHDEALDSYRRALLLAREISELHEEGKVLAGIAETVLQTEGPGASRIYWRQAHDLFQQLGVPEAETVRLRLATLPAHYTTPSTPSVPPLQVGTDSTRDHARDHPEGQDR